MIINVTDPLLNLNCGGVSSSLLQAAGPELQLECTRKAPNGLKQPGEILVTSAYNLHSKQLYHGFTVSDEGTREEVWQQESSYRTPPLSIL